MFQLCLVFLMLGILYHDKVVVKLELVLLTLALYVLIGNRNTVKVVSLTLKSVLY